MFRKSQIGILIVIGMISQQHANAQLVNIVDQAARTKGGEHFQIQMMEMASKDAKELNKAAYNAKDQSAAENALRLYISQEMMLVEHSWKFNDSQPRNYYRAQTANALEFLKQKYGLVPTYNFIERFIIRIDMISS